MRNGEIFERKVDAAVIGGGVIGLSVARELGRRGLSVALVERNRCGGEASFAAAGMLAPQIEADAPDAFFELACRSRDLYPAFAEELLDETGVCVELDNTGTLYLAFTEEDGREAERRRRWQQAAGFEVGRLTGKEARELEPSVSPSVRSALRFGRDWQVNNRQLISALVASAQKYNVSIHEHTEVLNLRVEHHCVRGVETTRGNLQAANFVIAGGAWSSLIKAKSDSLAQATNDSLLAPLIQPVRGQMLCFKSEEIFARHVLCSPRGYIVPRHDLRLLAGSTVERAGFNQSVTDEGKRFVMQNAEEIAPSITRLPLVDEWAGLRPRGESVWPLLGRANGVDNLLYATGHFRNGILLAPITARIIADMITRGEGSPEFDHEWLKAFAPERLPSVVA